MIALSVNGKTVSVEEGPTELLLDVLRNRLGLMGARFGCGAGECGACAVLVDGEDKCSCSLEIGSLAGKMVVTVEGLGTAERPHPIQAALIEKQAGQCGYCLTGIVIGAKALLDRNPRPSRREVALALDGHLCRCGAHQRIIDAVLLAAERIRKTSP